MRKQTNKRQTTARVIALALVGFLLLGTLGALLSALSVF